MTILAIVIALVAIWDLTLGAVAGAPKIPVLGNYLTKTIDFVLLGVAAFLLFFLRKR